jgi:quercetin dioxygenase-like cupin family protein
MDPRVITDTDRQPFPLLGAAASALATGADTGGAWEAMELDVGPGGRSPLHTISGDKLFYVADGELTIVLGTDEHRVTRGATVHVPAGTPHCYRNDGDRSGRLIVIASGAGHAAFLQGMSRLTAAGTPDPASVAAHAAAHGVTIIPPAPAPI